MSADAGNVPFGYIAAADGLISQLNRQQAAFPLRNRKAVNRIPVRFTSRKRDVHDHAGVPFL